MGSNVAGGIVKIFHLLFSCFLFFLLTACDDSGTHYAPVAEINVIDPMPKSGTHRVMQKESLYEVAWRYGLDYRDLAERNHLNPPFVLRAGQILSLRGHAIEIRKKANFVARPLIIQPKTVYTADQGISLDQNNIEPNYLTSKWIWPVSGKI